MTLQTQQPTPDNSPAVLTDEQRRRVAGVSCGRGGFCGEKALEALEWL